METDKNVVSKPNTSSKNVLRYVNLRAYGKDFLTIPEAIRAIEETFDVSTDPKNSSWSTAYKTIYKRIERELKQMNLEGTGHMIKESERKTKYSCGILDAVINDNLYAWLSLKAEKINQEEYERWKALKKKHGETYADFMEEGEKYSSQSSEESQEREAIRQAVQKYKLDIVMDYILSECIDLDEELLEEDIKINNHVEDPNLGDYAYVVSERLKDLKNYYTVKPRKNNE